MKLVVLGSGTSVPHPQRASAAFWLETETGSILLDCSADAAHRMAQENLDWPNLDAIWISHFHLDHCGGLAPYLSGTKWALQTQGRSKPLKIFGPAGTRRLLSAFDQANNYRLLEQPFPIEVTDVEAGGQFEVLSSVIAQTFSTPHTPESLALRLRDRGGASVVYTSDTGFAHELADFAHSVEALVIDCSFRRNKPIQKHLELMEVMKLAQRAQPLRVVLTHLYPEWDGIDIVTEAKTLWQGEVIAAEDGLVIEF